MTRMTGPDCVVMCNLINTYIHTYIHNTYIRPLKPLPAARADKAGKDVSQLDRALKVRACRGT